MPQWQRTRALVTGASGFIGAHLTRRLEQLGAEVHAVSRRPQSRTGREIWHQCDLRDAEPTAELLGTVRPDLLFHLASEVTGTRDVGMVRAILHGNLIAAVNLLTAAVNRPMRLVFAGSIEELRSDQGVPHSPYSAAKTSAAIYARLFHHLFAVDVSVLRIAMVYGPGQQDTTKLVPYVTTSLLNGQTAQLGSGTRLVDWIYIDDVIEAFIAAAESPKAAGGMYDVGSGIGVSIRDTVELLHRLAASPTPPEYGALPDRQLDRAHIADLAPTGAALGWQPRTSLVDGLKNTIAWYADQGRKT
ncbi:NAD-dependent epimerase/dehydratase family protein [Nonomuraea typhae]|uniref:NAD-dependent epimerase/dehydratase family protein n=1 Tax=Nonomuraea typhae TaxID=2603600 RepID=UPI0012FAD587|nr:NAD(P)-dependent oxidoreductase [Nonomuraea typhae]